MSKTDTVILIRYVIQQNGFAVDVLRNINHLATDWHCNRNDLFKIIKLLPTQHVAYIRKKLGSVRNESPRDIKVRTDAIPVGKITLPLLDGVSKDIKCYKVDGNLRVDTTSMVMAIGNLDVNKARSYMTNIYRSVYGGKVLRPLLTEQIRDRDFLLDFDGVLILLDYLPKWMTHETRTIIRQTFIEAKTRENGLTGNLATECIDECIPRARNMKKQMKQVIPGHIYAAYSPSNGMKIGYTCGNVPDRVRKFNIAVLDPYVLLDKIRCQNPKVLEKFVHKFLSTSRSVNHSRELFNISPTDTRRLFSLLRRGLVIAKRNHRMTKIQ